MRPAEHVEYLLKQGKKPKELLELGFSKRTISNVRRRLREEKNAQERNATNIEEPSDKQPKAEAINQEKLTSLENEIRKIQEKVELMGETLSEQASLTDMQSYLSGTPMLGLKERFRCECGASGFVAIKIQCTKCGTESWWGWFAKQ